MPAPRPDGAYRLGDVLSGYFRRHAGRANVTALLCASFPASLACAHAASGGRDGDVAALLPRVQAGGDAPAAAELAVHLRLGDVLDWPHYVRRRGCRAATGCYYVRPLSFYETVAVPHALRSAVLVGDPFYRAVAAYGSNRSLAYRSGVRDALRRRGLAVRVRPPSHPDADLAFLCGARHLLPGKGGFARIVAACVRRRGGKVYG